MPRPNALPPLAAEVRQIRALLPQEQADERQSQDRNIQVLCRFRGLVEAENKRGGQAAWELQDGCQGTVSALDTRAAGALSFSYDRVFGPEAKQSDIYDSILPVVSEVLNGTNGAVLCYGQTSAGKTFTMEGEIDQDSDLRGVIPRSLATLFDEARRIGSVRIHVSMLEIYMERLRDLLYPDNGAELRIVEDRTRGVVVRGLHEVAVGSFEQALEVFRCGQQHRAVAATGMNDRSSRSHSMCIIKVERNDGMRSIFGKLCLVDLAGSECLKKACFRGKDAAAANAEIVEESKAINQSLSTLSMVINRLADRRRNRFEPHVPYRSSKLTHVLKDVIGGTSQTVLVINCSVASLHVAETISTLRFGSRAGSVVNSLSTGQQGEESLLLQTLRAARSEIERLRAVSSMMSDPLLGLPNVDGFLSDLPSPIGHQSGRQSCSRRSLLKAFESRSLSPIGSPRRPKSHRNSISLPQSRNASVSPLQLTPRSGLPSRRTSRYGGNQAISQGASRCASRRVSRTAAASAAISQRVSLACSEAKALVSPLDLSPRSSRRASLSRRPSLQKSVVHPLSNTLEFSTSLAESQQQVDALQGLGLSAMPASPSPIVDFGDKIPSWEFPLAKKETFWRITLIAELEVEKLQADLDEERERFSTRLEELQQHCSALQAENEWLTADRMQHLEHAVRSSFEDSRHTAFEDNEEARTPLAAVSEASAGQRLDIATEPVQKMQVERLEAAEAEIASLKESLRLTEDLAEKRLARERHSSEQAQQREQHLLSQKAALEENQKALQEQLTGKYCSEEATKLQAEVERLKQALAVATQQGEAAARVAHEESARLSAELEDQHRSAVAAQTAIAVAQEESATLNAEVEVLRQSVANSVQQGNDSAAAAEAEASKLQAEVDRLHQVVSDKAQQEEAAMITAQEEITKLKVHVEQLQRAAADAAWSANASTKTAQDEADRLQAEIEQWRQAEAKTAHEAALAASAAQAESGELQAQVEQLRRAVADAAHVHDASSRASEAEVSRLQARIEQLEQAEAKAVHKADVAASAAQVESAEFKAQIEHLQKSAADTAQCHDASLHAAQAEVSRLQAHVEQLQKAGEEAVDDAALAASAAQAESAEFKSQVEQLRQAAADAAQSHEASSRAAREEVSRLQAHVKQLQQAEAKATHQAYLAASAARTESAEFKTQVEDLQRAAADAAQCHEASSRDAEAEVSRLRAHVEQLQQTEAKAAHEAALAVDAAQSESAALKAQVEQLRQAAVDTAQSHEASSRDAEAEVSRLRAHVEQLQQTEAKAAHEAALSANAAQSASAALKAQVEQLRQAAVDTAQSHEASSRAAEAEVSRLQAHVEQVQRAEARAMHEATLAASAAKAESAEFKSQIEQLRQAAADAAQSHDASLHGATAEISRLRAHVEQLQQAEAKTAHEAALAASAAQSESAAFKAQVEQLRQAAADAAQSHDASSHGATAEIDRLRAHVEQLQQAEAKAMHAAALAASALQSESAAFNAQVEQLRQAAVDTAQSHDASLHGATAEISRLRAHVEQLQQAEAKTAHEAALAASAAQAESAEFKAQVQQLQKSAVDAAQRHDASLCAADAEVSRLRALVEQLQQAEANTTNQAALEASAAQAELTKLKAHVEQLQKEAAHASQFHDTSSRAAEAEVSRLQAQLEQLQQTLTDAPQQVESSEVRAEVVETQQVGKSQTEDVLSQQDLEMALRKERSETERLQAALANTSSLLATQAERSSTAEHKAEKESERAMREAAARAEAEATAAALKLELATLQDICKVAHTPEQIHTEPEAEMNPGASGTLCDQSTEETLTTFPNIAARIRAAPLLKHLAWAVMMYLLMFFLQRWVLDPFFNRNVVSGCSRANSFDAAQESRWSIQKQPEEDAQSKVDEGQSSFGIGILLSMQLVGSAVLSYSLGFN